MGLLERNSSNLLMIQALVISDDRNEEVYIQGTLSGQYLGHHKNKGKQGYNPIYQPGQIGEYAVINSKFPTANIKSCYHHEGRVVRMRLSGSTTVADVRGAE